MHNNIAKEIEDGILTLRDDITIFLKDGEYVCQVGGSAGSGESAGEIVGFVPAVSLKSLGDPGFCDRHNIRYPYLFGAMANGITSVEMVLAAAKAGMLGFFGAAGLSLKAVETAIDEIQGSVGQGAYGFNLIHSPSEPAMEAAVVDLYLAKNVNLVEASAFMDMTLPLVRYRVSGIHEDENGNIVAPNRVIAKVSRRELAEKFFSPPPESFLDELLVLGQITAKQSELAAQIPMAEDLTAEADSGGHTDNRSALTLFPSMMSIRDRMQEKYGYDLSLKVGLAGGIATPASAAAAFSMGAAYVLTGSINQSAKEAGTNDLVREMLAKTGQADVTMAPAADMFEMGVKVQVLKWGTMFAMRAAKLYDLYKNYDSLDELPPKETDNLEKNFFRASIDQIWEQTESYFLERDKSQVDRAGQDPKHRMALVFRWYLGQTSHWANIGEPSRKIDYQIFCGPAMGAFNEWVKGSFLEQPANRDVVTMAMNILYGAALITRLNILKLNGIKLPSILNTASPLTLVEIEERL